MNRAQRRMKPPTKMYNMTKDQIRTVARRSIDKELKEAYDNGFDEGVNQAMILLLTLPMKVLMDHYWVKSYSEKIPEFTNYILEYYKSWQNDELDMDQMKKDLWEYGGVRLEVEDP